MIDRSVAAYRAAVLRELRSFFDADGHMEIDPPALARELIPEAHIEVFETSLVSPYGASEPRYLVPSPEIWLKRLLGAGYGSLYSLGKAFRNAESTSRIHRPEFTMLEWYTVGADHTDQIERTARLLSHLVAALPAAAGGGVVGAPLETMSVADSIERYAGVEVDLERPTPMREAADRLGLSVRADESDEDIFHRILVTWVEPALPRDHPVVLTDYPALVPTLARRRGPVAERWELYIAGMEVANCYHEETDEATLRRFLDEETARKRDAIVPHPGAGSLLEFAGAPACSGVALGVDRLMMALLEVRDIGGVIFFG